MEPLGQLLDGHELIRAVVELMPDRMERLVILRLDAGIGRAVGVPGQFAPGLRHVGAGTTPTQWPPGANASQLALRTTTCSGLATIACSGFNWPKVLGMTFLAILLPPAISTKRPKFSLPKLRQQSSV